MDFSASVHEGHISTPPIHTPSSVCLSSLQECSGLGVNNRRGRSGRQGRGGSYPPFTQKQQENILRMLLMNPVINLTQTGLYSKRNQEV